MERKVINDQEMVIYEIKGKKFAYPVFNFVKSDTVVEGDLDHILESTDTLGDAAIRMSAYFESVHLEEESKYRGINIFEYLKPKFKELVFNSEQHYYLTKEIDKTAAVLSNKSVQLDLFSEPESDNSDLKQKITGECMKALWFGYKYKDLQKLVRRMKKSRPEDIDKQFHDFYEKAETKSHHHKSEKTEEN